MSENRRSWERVMRIIGEHGLGPSDTLSVSDLMAVGDQIGVHMLGFPVPLEEERIARHKRRVEEIKIREEEERQRTLTYRAEQERTRPMRSAIKSRELRRKQKQKR